MKRWVGVAIVHRTFSVFILLLVLSSTPAFAQRQFQIRQMRSEMSSKIDRYRFGYSWDNKAAFDSLYTTFLNHQKIISKSLLWKNRTSNSVERNYFRMLANYGIGVLNNQAEKDPLVRLMLEYDPYLIPDESDNEPDLSNHIKTFFPLPSFKAGIRVGLNLNLRSTPLFESHEVVQNPSSNKKYGGDIGWHLSFPISYLLARNHGIAIEPGISYSNLKVTQQVLDEFQTYKYRLYYGDLAVLYRFSILNPKLKGFKGIVEFNEHSVSRLDSKIARIDEKDVDPESNKAQKLERRRNNKVAKRDNLEMNTAFKRVIPTLILGLKPKVRLSSFIDSDNSVDLTNWIQLDAVAGLGFDWYQSRNVFSIEFRYNYGLMDLNASERYYLGGEVKGLLFDDFFVSDDFRMQVFEISFVANYILSSKAFKIK